MSVCNCVSYALLVCLFFRLRHSINLLKFLALLMMIRSNLSYRNFIFWFSIHFTFVVLYFTGVQFFRIVWFITIVFIRVSLIYLCHFSCCLFFSFLFALINQGHKFPYKRISKINNYCSIVLSIHYAHTSTMTWVIFAYSHRDSVIIPVYKRQCVINLIEDFNHIIYHSIDHEIVKNIEFFFFCL